MEIRIEHIKIGKNVHYIREQDKLDDPDILKVDEVALDLRESYETYTGDLHATGDGLTWFAARSDKIVRFDVKWSEFFEFMENR